MIVSCDNSINSIYYNNHAIKKVYGCDGRLVWSGDTPTPPVSDVGRIKFQQGVVASDTATTNCVTSFTDVSTYGHRNLFDFTIANDTVCGLRGITTSSVVVRHIQSVVIPPATKHIDYYAFYGNLNSGYGVYDGTVISLNEGLQTIDIGAFRSVVRDIEDMCNTFVIPSTVTEISNLAFDFDGSSWASLPSQGYVGFKILFKGSTPPAMGTIFGTTVSQMNNNITIYVPSGTETAYRNALSYYSQIPIVEYTVGDENYNYIIGTQNDYLSEQGLIE